MSTPSLHSGLGIISCVLNIAALISLGLIVIIEGISKFIMLVHMFMAAIVIAMIWLFTAGFLCLSLKDMGVPEITFVEPWMLIITGVLLIMAFGLGVAGLMQSECKKVFSVLGCLFSISGLLAILGIHQMLH